MILSCKACGGDLQILDGSSICKCEYCGREQTLPKTDDEQTVNMLNRANHFRQVFEFDKAIEIYERMLNNGCDDAEIYWSLALCRYGIEYVDDPLTREKIPTCHRTQYTSILDDADYLMALKNGDSSQKNLYESEARYIDKVQKDILEISNKEDPFDVFICYKESDGAGNRTKDSVLAQDIYYQLIQKGYKVFFSRITLENKVGQQYEPYIFAALNSAKVMIVLGTKPEYFNAVWVKNEWNRYLAITHDDKSRLIIPAFKDMDPYDLPDALSYYQALDMSKIGFIQDLVRGIEKVLNYAKETKSTPTGGGSSAANSNAAALLKRGKFALEDKDWEMALKFFDQVLNIDAENGEAYLGMALANIKNSSLDEIARARINLFRSYLPDMVDRKPIAVSDEQVENFRALLCLKDKHSVKPYLANCKDQYATAVPKIEEYMRAEEMFLLNNRYISKAVRFSDSVKKEVEDSKNTVIADIQRALEEAKADEAANIQSARQRINVMYQKVEAMYSRKVENMERTYQQAIDTYNSGNFETDYLLNMFKSLGHYKDSDEYISRILEIQKQNTEQVSRLKQQRSKLWRDYEAYSGIGAANKQKREEINRQIRQIDEEIKRLR